LITVGDGVRIFRRDWQEAGLPVIALALGVAVLAVTSVGIFNERVWEAMQSRAAQSLGGDLVLQAHDPIAPRVVDQAKALGLELSQQVEFPSMMLTAAGSPRLVSVKAVDEKYPLRGTAQVAERPYGQGSAAHKIPDTGESWAHSRLFAEARFDTGDIVQLGEKSFRVSHALITEPDDFGSFFRMAAPRIMIRLSDLSATGLITSSSRAHYRIQLAGARDALNTFSKWLNRQDFPGLERRSVQDAQPSVRTALERASSFLGLASLSVVIVAGAGIFIAARFYARRQSRTAAVMRCLGASQRRILRIFIFRLVRVALTASCVGGLLGYAGQSFLSALAEEKLGFSLGPASLWPLLTGILIGLITALGFGLAPLLKLPTVSVLGILRGEEGVAPPSMWLTIGLVVFTSGGLIFWQADETVLTLWVMGLTACLVVGLACGGWAILWLVTQIRASRPTTRYVMSTVGSRRGMGVIQVIAFGLGITALLMVTVMRTQLMEGWMNSLPSDTPNRFLINIQPDQRTSLMTFFAEENLTTPGLYSMTRGRWVRHNGKPVEPQSFPTLQAQRFAAREFNLSSSVDLPHTNRIVSGTWWTADQDDEHLLSLEREFAQTLGVGIGDEMTFRVAGVDLTGRVSNLREVAWDSFEVNFFVITTPALLVDRPGTLITSFFLPAENTDTTIRLIQQFPSVTLFDIDSLMQQVRQIIQQVSVAVQYVFIFTLLAGIAVLTAAVQASATERSRDAAVLRALGASARRLWLTQFFEFALLGAVAGLLAATSAVATASILATEVFGFALSPGWWVWGLGCIGGALGIGVAGTVALRPVVSRAPLKSLISD